MMWAMMPISSTFSANLKVTYFSYFCGQPPPPPDIRYTYWYKIHLLHVWQNWILSSTFDLAFILQNSKGWCRFKKNLHRQYYSNISSNDSSRKKHINWHHFFSFSVMHPCLPLQWQCRHLHQVPQKGQPSL